MKAGPASIAEAICEELPLDNGPIKLSRLIEKIIQDRFPEMDPIEKAAEWEESIRLRLVKHIKTTEEKGIQPQIAFNSSSGYMIQGACFIEGADAEEIVEQKKRRLRWREYYETLQNLSPREFEQLCREILKLIGARNVKVTRETKDEGIDFYGKLSIVDLIQQSSVFRFRPFEQFLEIWLVGQAKHYKAIKVATPDLRELVGSIKLASARAFAELDSNKYPDLQIKVADPVFMLFFTTGKISIDGWQLVRRSGIIAMDGEILAAFLADHDVAIIKHEGIRQFSKEAFFKWVKKSKDNSFDEI
jgi:restriction endonuclease Mrr